MSTWLNSGSKVCFKSLVASIIWWLKLTNKPRHAIHRAPSSLSLRNASSRVLLVPLTLSLYGVKVRELVFVQTLKRRISKSRHWQRLKIQQFSGRWVLFWQDQMTKGNWQLSFRTWKNKKRQLYYTLAKSTRAFVVIKRCVLSLLRKFSRGILSCYFGHV